MKDKKSRRSLVLELCRCSTFICCTQFRTVEEVGEKDAHQPTCPSTFRYSDQANFISLRSANQSLSAQLPNGRQAHTSPMKTYLI